MALAVPSVKPLSRLFLGHDSAIKASFMALAVPSVVNSIINSQLFMRQPNYQFSIINCQLLLPGYLNDTAAEV